MFEIIFFLEIKFKKKKKKKKKKNVVEFEGGEENEYIFLIDIVFFNYSIQEMELGVLGFFLVSFIEFGVLGFLLV